jgi:hypothetical protein
MTSARSRAEVNFCGRRNFPHRDPLRFRNHVAVLDMHRKRLDDNGAWDLNA